MKNLLLSLALIFPLASFAASPNPVVAPPAPAKRIEPRGYWFIEPYLGVDLGLIDATTAASNPPVGNYSYSANGVAIGTRSGYNLASQVYFALDFQATLGGQLQVSSQPTGANKPNDNFYKIMLDMQAGWKPTESFQFWGGFFLLNDLTDQASAGNKVFHGDGFRIGAGWSILKNITLGFNYDILTYKKIDNSGTSYSLGNDYSKFNYQVFNFNCSFPFQL